jgi:hypothetical protein
MPNGSHSDWTNADAAVAELERKVKVQLRLTDNVLNGLMHKLEALEARLLDRSDPTEPIEALRRDEMDLRGQVNEHLARFEAWCQALEQWCGALERKGPSA